jgi:hypothetical protein
MAIDDQAARQVAAELETTLEKNDFITLHNKLIELATDKDSFNKIMSAFDEINQQRREEFAKLGGHLPDVEIHRDGWFGFGNVDQVVLSGLGNAHGRTDDHDKKVEIFETKAHRQAEEAENAKQSEPLHIDLGRLWAEVNQKQDWVEGKPDFHTDSSHYLPNDTVQATASTVRDFRSNKGLGAYEDPNAMRMTEEELERYLKGGGQ